MNIWGALAIPFLITLVLLFFFSRKMAWWEYALPLAIGLVVIGGCKYLSIFNTYEREYWGSFVTRAEYYEEWDSEESREVTYYDSDGNVCGSHTEYYTETHSAEWKAFCSDGEELNITNSEFEFICSEFHNKTFVELNRDYDTNDGDAYFTEYGLNGTASRRIPVTTVHAYKNKVAHSQSVFNLRKVNQATYNLYNHPEHDSFFNYPCILGEGPEKAAAHERLADLNAEYGPIYEIRMWILLFKDKPYQAGVEQEAYWKGGNKNEFTICIGTDSQNNVTWVKVISWTDVISLKVDCREYVKSQKKLDLMAVVDWLAKEIPGRYKRKHFSDFEYITVDSPLWMVILTYGLVLISSVGISVYATNNSYDADGMKQTYHSRFSSRYRRY